MQIYLKSKDIAKALKLSEATVSLVLNDRPGVSEKTRQKVLQYIRQEEEKYYENRLKQDSHTEETILIIQYIKHGIIFGRTADSDHKYSHLLKDVVCKAGYRYEFFAFDERIHDITKYVEQWKKKKLKGIYLMGAEMEKHDILYFSNLDIPIVVGDNNFYDMGIDSYLIDNMEGIKRCVDHLVDCGHSQIVYLAESTDIFNFSERRIGFIEEMKKRNCGDAKKRIVRLGNTFEEIHNNMLEYLKKANHRTTAYVLESSLISMGVMQALLESNVKIPRDVSLIGFDAVPPVNLSDLKLTTVKGTHTRRHQEALKHLMRHVKDEETEIIRVYYRTRLLEGNSVFNKKKYIYV